MQTVVKAIESKCYTWNIIILFIIIHHSQCTQHQGQKLMAYVYNIYTSALLSYELN